MLPWIGVALDQLYHRTVIEGMFGTIVILLSAIAIIFVLWQMIKVTTQKNNPARKALPILMVLEIGSMVSFIAALLSYLFL